MNYVFIFFSSMRRLYTVFGAILLATCYSLLATLAPFGASIVFFIEFDISLDNPVSELPSSSLNRNIAIVHSQLGH